MRHFFKTLVSIGTIVIVLGFIIFAEEVIPSASGAVSLCITSIIPSLLPFFVCSRLLLGFGVCEVAGRFVEKPFKKLFQLPGVFSAGFLLGSLCGYPMGAKICSSFYESGQCTKRQASFAAILCNNAGPLFIIGTLGTTLLHDANIGRQLWLLHLSSSILTTLLLRRFFPKFKTDYIILSNKKNRILDLFSESVSDSVKTILQICGLIIFFNAVIKTFICLGMPETGLLIGCIEMTTGLAYLVSENADILLPLCSFLLSFGGISVFMQVAAEFLPNQIPLAPYIIGKTIQGGISATLTYVFYKLFPISIPTSTLTTDLNVIQSKPILLTMSVVILAIALLLNSKRISRDLP